jgi:hypothetical protein
MLIVFHCPKCYEALCLGGSLAQKLYEKICDLYVLTSQTPQIDLEIAGVISIIKFLEKESFIVSTDAAISKKNHLLVKPLGYRVNEKGWHVFCRERCNYV